MTQSQSMELAAFGIALQGLQASLHNRNLANSTVAEKALAHIVNRIYDLVKPSGLEENEPAESEEN